VAKVILICGKICSGKTTYAKKLCRESGAVLLSVDEIMLAMFGQHCGDLHDTYAERTRNYLLNKAVELNKKGITPVLDWGFWTSDGRKEVRQFFAERDVKTEWHCIDISDATWHKRLETRNRDVLNGTESAYFVDENLAAKFESRFEMPRPDEIDVRIMENGASG